MDRIVQILANELGRNPTHVENVVRLIAEGNTIPFIARYRKELHGTMDDTTLRALDERLTYLRNLAARRTEISAAIDGQGKLTAELAASIENAATLAELDDLYRPYRPKRRTRATIAKEKGLEPLAELLWSQKRGLPAPETLAADFVAPDKGVENVDDALAGARDILAERISDDAEVRRLLRAHLLVKARLVSKAAKDEDSVYRLYAEFDKPVAKVLGYQTLAINRGEREEFLKVSVESERDPALAILRRQVVREGSSVSGQVQTAADDAYDRLIFPSLERELRSKLTEDACEGAIRNFALNLRPLLMQPPIRGKVTLGFDPAYRTGCKLAVVDATGKLLETAVIYPTPPHSDVAKSAATLRGLIRRHGVTAIAIGNGTASRESEKFVADVLAQLRADGYEAGYAMVNEAGASVYSASKLGAEEFPDYDVSLRSAVSIARRLQDPLAELVKIDPQSIGVGQYQHDMPQARLGEALGGVVEDCVNAVGVDVNTASPSLLARVAGLTATTAKNVVAYREANGPFTARKQLLKVSKLGPKAYEQCAGFLRVPGAAQPLDNTGVHPESYAAAEKLLALCGYGDAELRAGALDELDARLEQYGVERAAAACFERAAAACFERAAAACFERAATDCGVGVPTLRDIAKELKKPGRDPRDELPPCLLRGDVLDMKDLKPGMVLSGTVRNVIDFGAFVDIGVHQDGLVHISQICDRFIKHPSEVLKVGDTVRVVVLEVDVKRNRIGLSIKQAKDAPVE